MEALRETTYRTYTVQVPKKDVKMLRWLCKGMGWECKCVPQRKNKNSKNSK